jgi:acyl-CoA:acyl-CoA alkyltransferase
MRWNSVCIEQFASVIPDEILDTATVETRLAPTFEALHLASGQIAALTGVRERRLWPKHVSMASQAAAAGSVALTRAALSPKDIGAVLYAGVCRDDLEPATACAVADALKIGGDASVHDVSNACLGLLSGVVDIANRIELKQIKAGLVVSAESSRAIIDSTITELNAAPSHDAFRLALATMTGGSGAAAVLLTHESLSATGHRLISGHAVAEPQHHRHCRWGPSVGLLGETPNIMRTDATSVLTHGLDLGLTTWNGFLTLSGWKKTEVDKVISHQVGSAHRKEILARLSLSTDQDFSTFEQFGNTGTVSIPLTANHAEAAGFFREGDRVALLGIGSGLNCLMLGVQW